MFWVKFTLQLWLSGPLIFSGAGTDIARWVVHGSLEQTQQTRE